MVVAHFVASVIYSVSLFRPFRKVNERGVLLWDKIHELQKGQIYKQVCMCVFWYTLGEATMEPDLGVAFKCLKIP